MAEIMGFKTSVGDGLVEWFRRRTWVISLLVTIFIPLAFLADVVQDAVMIHKAPQGKDLELIWHIAKYIHVTMCLLTGMTLSLGLILVKPLKLIGFTALGTILGSGVWWLLFEPLKKYDWPDWAVLAIQGIFV